MSVEIRPLNPDEMLQLGAMGAYVYAGSFGDDDDNMVSQANLPEWTLCALEDGKLLSSFCAIPFTMRANGNAMALAGVSTVGTFPEYRRQGLVRRIHTQAFAEMRERGQTLAALWASQAAIYQRYGYALATAMRAYTVDTADIGFHDGNPGLGNVERLRVDDGYDIAKRVYIEFISQRMCYLHRAKALWLNNALDADSAEGPIHVAVSKDQDNEPNGYVIYTLRHGKVDHGARSQEIVIRDLAWTSQDAYRSLWSWIARHDLVGRVRWTNAPADDPAEELFIEPRLINAQDHEGIWLRIVDLAAALEARGYDTAGEISVEIVADDLAPWNVGAFKLEASPEGAHVTGSKAGEIKLSMKALSSLYTGFRSARLLSAWGLIEGSDDAIRRADAIFSTRHAPHCPDHF
ncbi:MAG: GNAT family N-acetyltransferase [Gammaproteobacteria bacterium]|nr:GNAT family N-acetyltransferase [Gammaproteobacteria bacterium]